MRYPGLSPLLLQQEGPVAGSWQRFWNSSLDVSGFIITPYSITVGVLLLIALWIAVSFLKRLLGQRIFPRLGYSRGVSMATASLIAYFVLFVGLITILQVALPGFNLGTLSVIAGALSFGIGFGLRNIADNFVSGLIILTERPIKIGDRIEIENLQGTVVAIRARSTTVRTNDNIDIIVPNSQFIGSRITNLSHNDNQIRFRVPVGVHYQSDVDLVEKALLEAASKCPDALPGKTPVVRFMSFGDSALNFELRIWSETLHDRPNAFISQVNKEIWKSFQKHGIAIPYPQQDIYLKEVPPGKFTPDRPS